VAAKPSVASAPGVASTSAEALTALYPPPGAVPVVSPATAAAPLHLLYPPPPATGGPSPRSSEADLTTRFPPPPSPHVRGGVSAQPGTPLPAGIAAQHAESPAHSAPELVEVPADSIWLLPGTIAVLDCGDRVVVRQNAHVVAPGDTAASSWDAADSANKQMATALDAVVKHVTVKAKHRYPVPSVHALAKPGSPQDRMLYCRLAPAHMEVPEAIWASLTAGPAAETAADHERNVAGNAARAGIQALCVSLTVKDIEGIVAIAPYTEQPSFSKYLINLVPGQAAKVLGHAVLSVADDASLSAAPMSQSMDRGPPVSIYQPSPLSNTPRSVFSSSDALPI
jgi:hypothetical protein